MTRRQIALIACANGLGHVRRLLALSAALRDCGENPVIFAPRAKVEQLCNAYAIKAPRHMHFIANPGSESQEESVPDLLSALPSLDQYDIIVSDNLVEILEVRPDAILSGSFFWHLSNPNYPANRAARANQLLREIRPRMIASDLFASPYLESLTQLTRVGLFAFKEHTARPIGAKTSILIACGTGGGVEEEARQQVLQIAAGPKPRYKSVYVEPSLFSRNFPDWIKPASFAPSMYKKLLGAVIRPGAGTATDALLAGARIFSFYESSNREMENNALRMEVAGVGDNCGSATEAWHKAEKWFDDKNIMRQHDLAVTSLDRRGAQQAAKTLISWEPYKTPAHD